MKNLLAIIISISLFSCKTGENATDKKAVVKDSKVTFIELKSGHNSGFSQAVTKVIKSQEEFNEVWTVLFANYMKKDETPEVDFENNVLVLVAAGEKNSGGYNIKVSKAVSMANKTHVTIIASGPGKNCVTTEAITYPYQLVQFEKTGQEFVFDTMEKLIDCASE